MEGGPDDKQSKKPKFEVVGGTDKETPKKPEKEKERPVVPHNPEIEKLFDAWGKNERYANRNKGESKKHDEDSEKW